MGRQRREKPQKKVAKPRIRYGIGEWFGKSFIKLTETERQRYASVVLEKRQKIGQNDTERETMPCPVLDYCRKSGGICSVRQYQEESESGAVSVVSGPEGVLRTVCPHRFYEADAIYQWVGHTILGDSYPTVLKEIHFLERPGFEGKGEHVGRIDRVLVSAKSDGPLNWCALEVQSVYQSRSNREREMTSIQECQTGRVPFPSANPRPDYRSSGPKRLMPQLQIKVPSLRRWGKKMAVVVDEGFFSALDLNRMAEVPHISNADIIWFIIQYEEREASVHLRQGPIRRTTLESAIDGLTAGIPVSLEEFEERIRRKLPNHVTSSSASQDSAQPEAHP